MMRLTLLLVLVLVARVAAADPDVVILPAADGKVAARDLEDVKQALAKAGTVGTKAIDATCAADTTCLTAAGVELRAKSVVGVAITSKGGSLGIGLVLVDVAAKELVAKRDLTLAKRKLAKDLPPMIGRLVQDGPVERAKDLFAQGSKHYQLGEFAPALELYKRAYRVKALPAFLFNIAQCHRKLGQHTEAVAMYQSYLVGVPNAPNKALVESLIAESKAALAQARSTADKRAAEAAQLESERMALDKKRSEDARKAKEADAIAAAERRRVEEARLSAERERELDKIYDRHPARTWAIVGGSVGIAAAIGGGFFTMRARSAQNAFDNAGCGDRDQVLDVAALAQCRRDQDRGEKSARLGSVLLGSGAGVLAAALVVFVLDPGNVERPEQARASVTVTPRSVQVVLPW
jgi:tetratricopeptide (TPR) repeat protein